MIFLKYLKRLITYTAFISWLLLVIHVLVRRKRIVARDTIFSEKRIVT